MILYKGKTSSEVVGGPIDFLSSDFKELFKGPSNKPRYEMLYVFNNTNTKVRLVDISSRNGIKFAVGPKNIEMSGVSESVLEQNSAMFKVKETFNNLELASNDFVGIIIAVVASKDKMLVINKDDINIRYF